MADGAPGLTVTVRTRLGQVIDQELEPEAATEVREALLQMIAALFALDHPENVRSITFDLHQ
jgi:hypothetical protein